MTFEKQKPSAESGTYSSANNGTYQGMFAGFGVRKVAPVGPFFAGFRSANNGTPSRYSHTPMHFV